MTLHQYLTVMALRLALADPDPQVRAEAAAALHELNHVVGEKPAAAVDTAAA